MLAAPSSAYQGAQREKSPAISFGCCVRSLLFCVLRGRFLTQRVCAGLRTRRTHEKELKAVAVRFEADAMMQQQYGGMGGGLQEPHVQSAIRVSSRQSIEASALTY